MAIHFEAEVCRLRNLQGCDSLHWWVTCSAPRRDHWTSTEKQGELIHYGGLHVNAGCGMSSDQEPHYPVAYSVGVVDIVSTNPSTKYPEKGAFPPSACTGHKVACTSNTCPSCLAESISCRAHSKLVNC